jgi:acetyl-CoA carboxylase biotin carboxyl carrier protein
MRSFGKRMELTEEEVHKILKLVDELDYGEIHLEVGDLRIDLVKRPRSQAETLPAVPATASRAASPSAESGRESQENSLSVDDAAPTPATGAALVVAPVAGTFYRAPGPGAKPFVEIGQRVCATDPVCLIEVMKLFQSIAAGTDGTVVQVLARDATVVNQGQALLAIEPEQQA